MKTILTTSLLILIFSIITFIIVVLFSTVILQGIECINFYKAIKISAFFGFISGVGFVGVKEFLLKK